MPQAAKRRSRESILFYATYTDRKCWLRCPVRQYSFEPQGDRRRRYFRLRRGVVTYDETRYNRGRLVSHGSEGGKARRSGVDDFDCRTRRRRDGRSRILVCGEFVHGEAKPMGNFLLWNRSSPRESSESIVLSLERLRFRRASSGELKSSSSSFARERSRLSTGCMF
jgi:hypothetical protein